MSLFRRRSRSCSSETSPSNGDSGDSGLFHGLFRRHSDSSKTEPKPSEKRDLRTTRDTPSNKPANGASRQAGLDNHHHPRPCRTSDKQGRSATGNTQSKRPDGKSGQNTNSHGQETKDDTDSGSSHDSRFTRKDITTLFSGAPFFLLEKGKHRRWYPQVIFPWDDHDHSILNMWDRKPLPHASYTLCTLHAHLPVPDGMIIKGDTPVRLNCCGHTGSPRRATFDIGVFEVPNMLSMNGKEPGSIGFRHFLELPVADSALFTGPVKPQEAADFRHVAELSAVEAYDLLQHHYESYGQCRDGTIHDRKSLLRGGPSDWKEIGVRDVSLQCLVERLRAIGDLRREILHGEIGRTLIDVESPRELYNGLFTKFLHTPPHAIIMDTQDKYGLKSQIKILTTVLATPGAWIDFSLVEWRLRVGQVLWEEPPHSDGDCLEPDGDDHKLLLERSLERKWFLIQMLLAGELLLRLDAVVRVGILQGSHDMPVSPNDVHLYDRLRNDKVDWDLVVVRRFLDSLEITYSSPASSSDSLSSNQSREKSHKKHAHFFESSFFENLTHKAPNIPDSAWNCQVVPLRVKHQLQGLFAFAENIGWPHADALNESLNAKVSGGESVDIAQGIYRHPVRNTPSKIRRITLGKHDMYSRSPSRRLVLLQDPQDLENSSSLEIGGWLSRSWFSGFVVPGESISHLLMCTLLENDADAIDKLGCVANIYGGFSYNGRTWWSNECIVGRVLSSMQGTETCLGWMSSPILPIDASTSNPFENKWFDVLVKNAPPVEGRPRIKQGHKLAMESTPLGTGELCGDEFSLPVDSPIDTGSSTLVEMQKLTFLVKCSENDGHITVVSKACVLFSLTRDSANPPTTISLPLTYNIRFISSHECRPPLGIASLHCKSSPHQSESETPQSSTGLGHREHSRLPGHPMHQSYAYEYISLDYLPRMSEAKVNLTGNEPDSDNKVLVIDARGPRDKEAFARAWCASVGSDAIIGRVGMTCLACCVREAMAIHVGVVIRVGDGVCNRPSSIHAVG